MHVILTPYRQSQYASLGAVALLILPHLLKPEGNVVR